MRLPRWTVYPALAVIGLVGFAGVPYRPVDPAAGMAAAARAGAAAKDTRWKKVVVLGIDGLDPDILQETCERFPDRMPNFRRLIAEGELVPLGTSVPPQSPVAWSNFITGRNPGGHGVYDFIHRDPMHRTPVPGSVKSVEPSQVSLWGDWKFPIGGDTPSNRSGESFWRTLARHGVPADVWRMPANFPVEPAKGVSFPGMMTPAMDSAYGTWTLYTTNPPAELEPSNNGRFVPVREFDGVIETSLQGPPNSFKEGDPNARASITVYLDRENGAAAVSVGDEVVVLEPGQWSDFVHLSFELLPLHLADLSGVARFYLRSIEPHFEMYASPVNFDPNDPATPISLPEDAAAELAAAIGVYYTQGMAEEVNALKDDAITPREFIDQATLIYDERVRMMDYALDKYLADDEGGLFFFYYSTIDLTNHMVWHIGDEQHPHHAAVADFAEQSSEDWSGREGSRWKDVVHDLYTKMDPVLGRMRERIGDDALLIVMSDHGFAPWHRMFSLNTWLYDEGYLVLKAGKAKELPRSDPDWKPVHIFAGDVDWSRTRAFGMGFNGLYLNMKGRELDDPDTDADESGIVAPDEAEALLREIAAKLEALRDTDGTQIVLRADLARDVYQGERLAEAPDIQVGYNSGYGNSDASSTGRVPNALVVDNDGGTFNGNHLMAPEVVEGTLLTTGHVRSGAHRLEDLTVELLHQYGIEPGDDLVGHPVLEDERAPGQ